MNNISDYDIRSTNFQGPKLRKEDYNINCLLDDFKSRGNYESLFLENSLSLEVNKGLNTITSKNISSIENIENYNQNNYRNKVTFNDIKIEKTEKSQQSRSILKSSFNKFRLNFEQSSRQLF